MTALLSRHPRPGAEGQTVWKPAVLVAVVAISAGAAASQNALFLAVPMVMLALLGWGVLIARDFRLAVILYVVVTPLATTALGLDFGHGLPLLTLQRVMLLTLLAAWVGRYGRGELFRRTSLDPAIALFALWRGLTVVFASGDWRWSLVPYLAEVIECYLTYYLVVRAVADIAAVRTVLVLLVLGGVGSAAYGLYEAWNSSNPLDALFSERWYWDTAQTYGPQYLQQHRIHSIFSHPLLFAWYLAAVLPLAAGLALSAKGWIAKAPSILAMILMALALVLTLARSVWIGICLSGIVLTAVAGQRTRLVPALVVLLLALYMILPALPFVDTERLSAFLGNMVMRPMQVDSIAGRVDLLREGVALAAQRPWGYGYGTMGAARGRSMVSQIVLGENYYVSLLLESGVPAVALFLSVQLATLFVLWRRAVRAGNSRVRVLCASVASTLAGYGAILFGVGALGTMLPLFWSLTGLGVALTMLPQTGCGYDRQA